MKIFLFGLAPMVLFCIGHGLTPDPTLRVQSPGSFILGHRSEIAPDTHVIVDNNAMGAASWYLQRTDLYMLGYPGEFEYGLGYPDGQKKALDVQEAVRLIRANPGKVVILGRVEKIAEWRDTLPKPTFEERSSPNGFIFMKF